MLIKENIGCWLDFYEIGSQNIKDQIQNALSACSYLIVLLSANSIKSKWVQYELNLALTRDLNARNITLLPVLLEDCEIPISLSEYFIFDLRNPDNLNKLINHIRIVPQIDFSALSYKQFEDLIEELLIRIGFKNIEREWEYKGNYIDIKGVFSHNDPFGEVVNETWIVEVKLYKSSRADIKTLNQLFTILQNFQEPVMGLLVTNGQLTSAAQDWLNSENQKSRLRIIDGPKLKRYLMNYNDIVNKYFHGSEQNECRK